MQPDFMFDLFALGTNAGLIKVGDYVQCKSNSNVTTSLSKGDIYRVRGISYTYISLEGDTASYYPWRFRKLTPVEVFLHEGEHAT